MAHKIAWPKPGTSFKVYRFVNAKWTDPWGQQHDVERICATRVLRVTEEWFQYNDGYADYDVHVCVDRQGRRYADRGSYVDYWHIPFYWRIDKPRNENECHPWFSARSLRGKKLINSRGKPLILKEDELK